MLIQPFELQDEFWAVLNILDIRPNVYELSNYGNVRRIEDKYPIKAQVLKNEYGAYRIVNLATIHPGCKNKKYLVHRLVAIMFVENPNNYPQVNHLNNNGMDECYQNLSWCTENFNTNYQYMIGDHYLTNLDNYKIYSMIENGMSNSDIMSIMNSPIVNDEYIDSIRASYVRNNPVSEYEVDKRVINSSKYSNSIIIRVCELFQSGLTTKDYIHIAQLLDIDISTDKKKRTFYAYCSNIYNRRHHTHISKDYNW